MNFKRTVNAGRSAVVRRGRPPSVRRKLLQAAQVVMSRRGLDGSTLTEIIDEAGVGAGSFYNHFSSKEDLAKAVFAARTEHLGAALEELVYKKPDAAVLTCYAYRYIIQEAIEDKLWGSFIIQLEPQLQMLDRLIRCHVRVGVRWGVDSGRFVVPDVEASITIVNAMEVAIIKATLSNQMSAADAHRSAIFALRIFGVHEPDAIEIASWSMSKLRRAISDHDRRRFAKA